MASPALSQRHVATIFPSVLEICWLGYLFGGDSETSLVSRQDWWFPAGTFKLILVGVTKWLFTASSSLDANSFCSHFSSAFEMTSSNLTMASLRSLGMKLL